MTNNEPFDVAEPSVQAPTAQANASQLQVAGRLNRATRRQFFKIAGASAGGLVLGVQLTGCGDSPPALAAAEDTFNANAFLQITADNKVRFYCPRDEMGQGVTTGLTTVIAEELDVAPQAIEVRLAAPHPDYDNPLVGMQVTGGSTSLAAHFPALRETGAVARYKLLQAAASQFGIDVAALETHEGNIIAGEQSYPYGDFVEAARLLADPTNVKLKERKHFKYIGTEFPRLDAAAKSTGTAQFGIDAELPGLHRAVIIRSPSFGGKVKSFDAQAALALPEISDVIEVDSGIAVVGSSYWQVQQAAKQVEVEWDLGESLGSLSSEQVRADYEAAVNSELGDEVNDAQRGNVDLTLAQASHRIDVEYWAPYLAHTPLEPMNATVHIENDSAQVWCGSQSPFGVQGLVARAAGLSRQQVTVHPAFMGGGFGRRAVLNFVTEATQIAKLTGKPIQLIWSREDDIQHGIYRPAALMQIRASIEKEGKLSAWYATRVGANLMPTAIQNTLPGIAPMAVPKLAANAASAIADTVFDGWTVDHSSVEGLYEDYDFPHRSVRHITLDHGLPVTFWRSVGHSYTAFAIESAIDELAIAAGLDPIEVRLANTEENPRLNGVLKALQQRLAQEQTAPDHFWGVAAHTSFGSYVAQAAEVKVHNGQIAVRRVLCAVDCGLVVNPDIVRAQMEGAIMFGLTAALFGEIELADGRVKQSNFHDYPILRMHQAPMVDTILVPSDAAPTGVGEPGLPPIAPAVANAVYAATGQRLRNLPLKLPT